MPYLKKDELTQLILSAFNEGILAAVEMDHHEGTPEQLFNALDVEKFLKENPLAQHIM